MSYCPKCGRRIYQEEKGCDFCGIVNDKSLWEGVGGMKSQTSSLDYDFSERPQEVENKVPARGKRNREDSQQWQQQAMESQEENPFPTILKVVLIAFVALVPYIGLLVGLLCGFILKASPYESYRHFGKVLHWILIVIVLAWVVIAIFSFASFVGPESIGSFQFSIF